MDLLSITLPMLNFPETVSSNMMELTQTILINVHWIWLLNGEMLEKIPGIKLIVNFIIKLTLKFIKKCLTTLTQTPIMYIGLSDMVTLFKLPHKVGMYLVLMIICNNMKLFHMLVLKKLKVVSTLLELTFSFTTWPLLASILWKIKPLKLD